MDRVNLSTWRVGRVDLSTGRVGGVDLSTGRVDGVDLSTWRVGRVKFGRKSCLTCSIVKSLAQVTTH